MEQEQIPVDDVSNSDKPQSHTGLSLRLGLALLALVVVGGLVFQFTQGQISSSPAQSAPQPTATVSEALAGPLATAQANPNSADAQFELGNALYQQGQMAPAIEAYKAAIELDPQYTAAYANLGVTYYQMQEFELAARQYEKALELNPNDGDVAYNLGALYLQQALSAAEQPDTALLNQSVEQLEQARQLSPELAEPYFTLGVAYLAMNQPAQARESFETFLSLGAGQDARAKQEAERYLDMLNQQ
ncbi:MAG: hypothetical protein Kow0031_12690 [Anaerolineae bacterium]